jgi:hypothetical protein
MRPKKPVDYLSKGATENERHLLQYGPRNNIISWRDRMQEECVEKYGMTGTFFTTDRAYIIPYPVRNLVLGKRFHSFPETPPDP